MPQGPLHLSPPLFERYLATVGFLHIHIYSKPRARPFFSKVEALSLGSGQQKPILSHSDTIRHSQPQLICQTRHFMRLTKFLKPNPSFSIHIAGSPVAPLFIIALSQQYCFTFSFMSYFPTIPCFCLGGEGGFHDWLISPGQSSSLAHQSVNSTVASSKFFSPERSVRTG